MKIAMLSEHASPLAVVGGVDAGGQNVHVAALASALAERGHRVTVYTRRDDADLRPRVLMRDGVIVEHLDAGPPVPVPKDDLLEHVPELGRELRARLIGTQPDVLHAHFWMSGLAALQASSGLDIPVVQTFHALGAVKRRMQGQADSSPASRIELEERVARQAKRVIASCADERSELIAIGAAESAIDVVPSGVDCSWFVPEGPSAPRGYLHRLLAIGRLVPRKGIGDAIAALKWLPDTELIVAGGPNADSVGTDAEAARLMELARECGVADRVRLVGQVPHSELPALIRSADVVVCLPWYEPFGIVPLEAMACGVPVVGTAVGGLLDTIEDGVTGVLVRPQAPRPAAQAIKGLLDDPQRQRRMGAAGRQRALGFSWARVAEDTERTYLRAMGAQASGHKPTQSKTKELAV
jgi:D-inositol-3-phosphate glycosyltransferase